MGKMQYPKTHTLWKKDRLPPSRRAFTVTTADPNHTMTNTAANTKAFWSSGAFMLNTIERKRHNTRGPHKSQFLLSSLIDPALGHTTKPILLATMRTSRSS